MNTITFRFVRQVFTTSRTVCGDAAWDCHHSSFVVDATGDWVEKTYADGARSYKMAADCNLVAIAKLREG